MERANVTASPNDIGKLRVRIFAAEAYAPINKVPEIRDQVTNSAVAQYEGWMRRNESGNISCIQDISTEHTSTGGKVNLLKCVIVVKYFGNYAP